MTSSIPGWRRQQNNYSDLGRIGKVVSKTRIIEAPSGFSGPYWVVMIQLEKHHRVLGQWADEVEPKIKMKVVGVLRRIGEADPTEVIEYGVKWKKW